MRKQGFSLMEMMIVLLIVSVVAAASAPMLNKKMVHNAAEMSSPWSWVGSLGAVFDMPGTDDANASIGAVSPPTKAKLYIKSNSIPQLLLGDVNNKTWALKMINNSIFLTNKTNPQGSECDKAIAIGSNVETSQNGIVIGSNSSAKSDGAIALGADVTSDATDSIAIGTGAIVEHYAQGGLAIGVNSTAKGDMYTTALGYKATATKKNAIAIGSAYAENENSVAIGAGAKTTSDNEIVLGTADTTVYIPGNLIVDKNVVLNTNGNNNLTYFRIGEVDSTLSYFGSLQQDTTNYGMVTIKQWPGTITSGYNVLSDKRIKNVKDVFDDGLEQIKKLEIYNYTFKKDPTKTPRVGVIAQDLQQVFPNAVTKGDDGFLRIRWDEMFFALINSVKELDNEQSSMKAKITELEKQNKSLIKQNADFEKRLKALEKNK